MKKIETPFEGLYVLEPKVFGDERGFFLESYNEKVFSELGLHAHWVQDNHSRSQRGVLRGLHFQKGDHAQIKLVRVMKGRALDVVVDIRPHSKTFGQSYSIELSDENKKSLYVPCGFAHGFCVLEDNTDFTYKCSRLYAPEFEGGIVWNDPKLGIDWPVDKPQLSPRDLKWPTFEELKKSL
jgi:dTDP-4-dehydrorhamnose 3,5-epimerase